ncbi:uncharacterized protein [Heptranchias perlo]|uniref:uncharacterized protein isoform X2 n=1 Tax=Heptranchias perlo TaxID=212740 RepID=UPI0035593DE7
MDPPHRTLLLCLLLCSWVAVFSNRLSGNAGVTCCQRILQSQLSKAQLKVLKSYVHLPSHAACSEYLQFTTYAGQSFCVSLREGWVQEMKDTVDSRSKGSTMTAHGGPRQGDQVEPQVGIGLYPGDSDKERGSSGEADRATKGQWLKLGLILVTAVLLLAAAIALVSVKLKKRPAVVVELIRYSAYSDARDGAV